jgi:hypothetical protein
MRPQAYSYQEFMNKSNLQSSLVLCAAAYQSNSVKKGFFTPSSLHPLPPQEVLHAVIVKRGMAVPRYCSK